LLAITAACSDEPSSQPQSLPRAFSVAPSEIPWVLPAGGSIDIEITLRNEGRSTWVPTEPLRVTYRWGKNSSRTHQSEPGKRFLVPGVVEPGQETRFPISIVAPDHLGAHRLEWRLVSKGQGLYTEVSAPGRRPITVLITPSLHSLFGWLLPLLCSGLALWAIEVARRRPSASYAPGIASAALLTWGAASIFGKPFLLYADLDIQVRTQGLWIGASIAAFFTLLLLPWGRRVQGWITWAMALVGALLVWSNILYARFFGDVIASGAFKATGQAGALWESILQLAQSSDALLLPDLCVGLFVAARFSGSARNATTARGRWIKFVVAGLLCAAAAPAFVVAAQAASSKMGTGRRNLQTIRSVQELGLHGYELQDFWNRALRSWEREQLSPEKREGLIGRFIATAPGRAGVGPWFGVGQNMNVVLVQVEALQQFVIGLEIDGQEITPNLNRLFATGISFSKVQAQTGQGRSSAADFTFNTSLLPIADSIAYEFPANRYNSTALELEKVGYTTLAAIPFKKSFWNRHVTFPAYGFRNNLFREDFAPGEKIGWGLNDRDFMEQMLDRVQSLPEPFCAWLLPLALHYPYSGFPDKHKVIDLGIHEGTSYGNYLHGMSFTDRAFGDFYEGLRASTIGDRTVIVLWGDHGSGLSRRQQTGIKIFGDNSKIDQLLRNRVPVSIWIPQLEGQAMELDLQAGQVDLPPTILALLGIDPAPLAFLGRNLLGTPESKPIAHPRGNWISENLAYLPKGDSFEEGVCVQIQTKRRVSVERCRAFHQVASRDIETSRELLAYDFQAEVSEELGVRLAAE
jgi:phosphoglycerol transferase MdoB-like AlkP superfamily enzyme